MLIGLGTTQAQDIFKKYGHKKEMLTLSKGKYQEVFKNEEVVQIGTVLLNTKTNKIVKLLQEDTTKINYNAELSSRFLTVDPMAEEYYSYSPYAYAMNNPVYYVDPTGEFSTKFGAWLYKVFNGGGDILQDKGGEYFVSQQVEYTGEGVGAAVSRKFDWSGRSTGKDLAFEAKLDAFKTDMEFQQLCEQHGMEYVRYDNRSDAIAGMLQPASAVVLPNPIVRTANTAINSIGKSKVVNTINGAVKSNFERFVKKMPANARTNATWKSLDDGTYLFEASSAAKNIPGSKAVYQKWVNADGVTIKMSKTTYAPDGSIVHVKPK